MRESNKLQAVDWDRTFAEGSHLDEAVTRGVREALARHKALRQSIVVCRDGRPVWIAPDDIEIPSTNPNITATPFQIFIEQKPTDV